MKEFFLLGRHWPGALVDIAEALGAEHINIEGIAGLAVLEEGVVGLVTDDHGKARRVLRDKGIDFEEREALVIDLPNHPGELAAILPRLSAEGINVLSVYAAVGKHQAIF